MTKTKYTKKSEIGKIYGFWEVLDFTPAKTEDGKQIPAKAKIICRKDNCGTIKEGVYYSNLISKNSFKWCTKHKHKRSKETEIGKIYGNLRVIDFIPSSKNSEDTTNVACAIVVCERENCPRNGEPHKVVYASLISGATTSCGCYKISLQTKHGLANHPYYRTCVASIRRCNDPNNISYDFYGGRGITCFWTLENIGEYIKYLEENLPPKQEGLTLDRKDNDKGYQPGNLRWATPGQQTENQRPRISHKEYDSVVKELEELKLKSIFFEETYKETYEQIYLPLILNNI